jgi:flagellar M-ring protein FliF
LLLVVRPLLSKLLEAGHHAQNEITAGDDSMMITDQSGQMQLAGAEGNLSAGGAGEGAMMDDHDETDFDSMIDIAHIDGRVKASSMKKIGEIIDAHPEEAVSILRNWMYQDAS